ncbi:hypothetical protein PHMEG_00032591, partial [Phytophthora megakarya]
MQHRPQLVDSFVMADSGELRSHLGRKHAEQITTRYLVKVYELLKKRLETGLITHSESEWSSPIVIVLKKNGEDIRMCFMSLDMASGFWAIQMTERAKLISAFFCPFGHFQWIRMPFGLKNAPIRGFVRVPPEEEAKVDRDVLEFLELTASDAETTVEIPRGEGGFRLPELMKEVTAFSLNYYNQFIEDLPVVAA